MAQSRFINLTQYCVVEYMFEPLNSLNFLTEDFVLIENEHANVHQIFNEDGSYSTTKNIRDLSVTPIENGRYAYLDSEKIPNYSAYDDKIQEYPINGYNVVFDKVRFHFISGFDFDSFEALVLGIRNTENDNKTNIFANLLVSPETIDELITFNPKPLFLSSALYDRYIEIKVPSIKNINEEYNTAPVRSATFSAAITPNLIGYTGFITNKAITIVLDECGKRGKIDSTSTSYDYFEITQHFEAPLSQTNEFDGVGAYVNEATNGDFIEFFLTFNSGFPEELISILNRRNPSDDWIIIHQLNVFEQVGTSFINTARQVFFQEDGFDEPMIFRPILKNASEAISMSIDLLCRLTNRRTGEQIIREASYIQYSPKKYGKKLSVIPLSDAPQSQKIYNKLIQKNFEQTNLFIEPSFAPGFEESSSTTTQVITQVEYVPIFFTNNNISVSNRSAYVKLTDQKEEIIFSAGKLRFILSPFDNAVKLKVFNIVDNKPIALDLNLNASKYRLVFDTDSGKVPIDNANSDKQENLALGELFFRIPKKESEKIITSALRTVYLTTIAQDGTETLMYNGEWRKPEEQSDVDSAIEQAKQEADERNEISAKLDKIDSKNTAIQEGRLVDRSIKLSPIKNKAVAPVVNRVGLKDPKKVKTNTSNAGKNSTGTSTNSGTSITT